MATHPTALERARQLARHDDGVDVAKLRKQLKAEGYVGSLVSGPGLARLLHLPDKTATTTTYVEGPSHRRSEAIRAFDEARQRNYR
ncbi:MAG: hypothetical protein ABW003_20890 [Microvirga sp.]